MYSLYQDRWIECTPDEICVRAYYFPWGDKHIPFATIRGVRRVELAGGRGKGRIWGTSNPRYWAGLDPRRPSKEVGLVLDLGRFVRPFLTPDDPDAVQIIIGERAHVRPDDSDPDSA